MTTVLSEPGALRPCVGDSQRVSLPPAVVPLVGETPLTTGETGAT